MWIFLILDIHVNIMAYRVSQKVVVKTTSNLLFYNKLDVVLQQVACCFITSCLLFYNKLLVILIDMKNNKQLVVFHVDHNHDFHKWKSIFLESIYSNLPIIGVRIFNSWLAGTTKLTSASCVT